METEALETIEAHDFNQDLKEAVIKAAVVAIVGCTVTFATNVLIVKAASKVEERRAAKAAKEATK